MLVLVSNDAGAGSHLLNDEEEDTMEHFETTWLHLRVLDDATQHMSPAWGYSKDQLTVAMRKALTNFTTVERAELGLRMKRSTCLKVAVLHRIYTTSDDYIKDLNISVTFSIL